MFALNRFLEQRVLEDLGDVIDWDEAHFSTKLGGDLVKVDFIARRENDGLDVGAACGGRRR